MTSSNTKLKILAIHGYRQSDKIFSAKLGSLRKSFKRDIEFKFITAPHEVPSVNDDDQDARDGADDSKQFGWWFNTEDKVFKAVEPSNLSVGFEESVLLIENTFKEHGPFDGLLGFSQGGSFVSLLCAMQQKNVLPIKFGFAIIISGFKSLCEPHQIYYNETLSIPSLHVYGDGDKVIPTCMAKDLRDLFVDNKSFVHEGGHFMPGKKQIYNEFFKEMIEKKINKNDASN